jgi:hypothetical protein
VREQVVWRDIDVAFSTPVAPGDDVADCAPTQVLAEFFREKGLGGVAYRSSLGPGHNLVVFDVNAADVVNCGLLEIECIKLSFSEVDNRYFMTDRPEESGEAGV